MRPAPAAPQYFSAVASDPIERSYPCLTDHQMTDARREAGSPGWIALVLRDVQFWVPVVVLTAGLLVLRWIS